MSDATPTSRQPVKLTDMMVAVSRHVTELENTEVVARQLGLRNAPFPERAAEIEIFSALHRFLVAISPRLDEVRELLRSKPRRRY
jgi:ABC-type polysaccharide/polyol phosphate transport system ATPase subunit